MWPLLAFSVSSHSVTHFPPPHLPPSLHQSQQKRSGTVRLTVLESLHVHLPLLQYLPSPHMAGSFPPLTPPKSIPGSLLTLQALLCAYHLADCTVMNAVFPLIEMDLKWDVGSLSTVSPFVARSLACRPCSVHACGVSEWSQGKLREDRGLV